MAPAAGAGLPAPAATHAIPPPARSRRPEPGSSAGAGLRFTRGVLRPFCLCRRSDIGTQCRVRVGEKRHLPHPHGAVRVSGGQELAVRAEHHPRRAARRPVPAGRGTPTACPVAGFHSRTYPSVPAVASSLPSRLNATPFTPPLVTAREGSADGLPAGRVPQPHGAVAVRAGQQLAVRGERCPFHAAPRVSREGSAGRPSWWPGPTAVRTRPCRRWPVACRPG